MPEQSISELAEQLTTLMRNNGVGEEVKTIYQYVKHVAPIDRELMALTAEKLSSLVYSTIEHEIQDGISAPEHTQVVWAKKRLRDFYKVAIEDAIGHHEDGVAIPKKQ